MKKALLVGINQYQMGGCNLNGCPNDAKKSAVRIVRKGAVNNAKLIRGTLPNYGFEPENIRMLLDARATTQAILARLHWLVEDAKPGDVLFFHYSGHGAQYASRAGSGEVDGLNEVICPHDFDWTPEYMITDKQFVEIFSQIPDGVQFNWLSDSCHSGDLTRSMIPLPVDGYRRPRNIEAPADIQWRIDAANAKGLTSPNIASKMNVGYASGCRDNQVSMDIIRDGLPCGAHTSYFWEVVGENPNASLADIVAEENRRLARDGYSQRPQAEGLLIHKPFLGGIQA